AETLAVKPLFKIPFLKRRCVVPAEAFYEWVGPKGRKQPLSIGRADGKLLSMAGLFNYWKPKDSEGSPIATFTVITTAPTNGCRAFTTACPPFCRTIRLSAG